MRRQQAEMARRFPIWCKCGRKMTIQRRLLVGKCYVCDPKGLAESATGSHLPVALT